MRLLPVRILSVLAIALLIPTSVAADHHESEAEASPAHLLRIAAMTVSDSDAFEEGLATHNAFHAEQGDEHFIVTATITSGPRIPI